MPATALAFLDQDVTRAPVLLFPRPSLPGAPRLSIVPPLPTSPGPRPAPITDARPQTFRTFVVGACNAVAYNAVLATVKAPEDAPSVLWVTGGDGMGKTHLLHAIAAYAPKYLNGAETILMTGDAFIRDYDLHLSRGLMTLFRQRYRRAGLLLIDGMGAFAGHDTAAEELAGTLAALGERGRHAILADGRIPTTIVGLLPRFIVATRKTKIVELLEPGLDDNTRGGMMRKTAEAWGLMSAIGSPAGTTDRISEDALGIMVGRLRGSFRDAETALSHLVSEATTLGVSDTATLAAKVASFINREPYHAPKSPQVEALIASVCYSYNVPRERLLGRGREMTEARARQVLMYLLSADLELTAKHIGKKILDRDHSTVLYGKAKIAREVANEDPDILSAIDDIRKVAVSKLSEAALPLAA